MAAAIPFIQVAGAVAGIAQGRKAAKATRQANAAAKRAAELKNARERRKQAAERRKLQAEAVAEGAAAGVGAGSSGVQGTISSIGSQFGANVGFSQQLQQLENQRQSGLERSARATRRGQTLQSVASTGAGIIQSQIDVDKLTDAKEAIG